MAEDGAGAQQGPEAPPAPGEAGAVAPEDLRDWAGLPEHVLVKVAGKLVAQTEAWMKAYLKGLLGLAEELIQFDMAEELIQSEMERRKADGNCLFVFALVCKPWRKAQLKVGGRLCTRVRSDVIRPGSVALAKWALAEGCPREIVDPLGGTLTMARVAAIYGHGELVQWLCGEGGFAMNEKVMMNAALGGNLQLVQWLRAEGCPWSNETCHHAVNQGHVDMLRWVRENGCPWNFMTRHQAATTLGYTDDFGNMVDGNGDPI